MNIKFKSKAQNLEMLQDKINKAKILPQISFNVDDWQKTL